MRFLAVLLACLGLSAHATTLTTDFTDLWWNSTENGWGVTLTQQREVIFVTFFVYGPNNQPRWYVGPATTYAGTTTGGGVIFSGPLYEVTGPYFGATTYDPNQVNATAVGTVSFAAGSINAGAISYTVNNVTVTKQIQRQTFRIENVSGIYVGSSVARFSDCGSPNGYVESPAVITIGHDGLNGVALREEGQDYTCNYQGIYLQSGRFGQINAVGSCSNRPAQTFLATEVLVSVQGITMRYEAKANNSSCTGVGRMGGVRRGQ